MNNLGVREKDLKGSEDRPLKSVAGSYTYFAEDDVLLAKITPCFENGKLGIARGLTNDTGFGSSEFFVLRPTEDLDPEYLFYFLSQDSFRDAGSEVMTGAVGHKRVPKEFIENHHFPIPPLAEQKRIVAILDEAFAGIDTVIANTEKNLASAQELFEGGMNKVFGSPSNNWLEKSLGDICILRNGRAYKKNELLDKGKYPVLRVGNFFTNKSWYYSDLELEETKYCDSGDLLYAWSASFGPRIWKGGKAIFHYHIWRVDIDNKFADKMFLYYWLIWDATGIQKEMGAGTTMVHVSMKSMNSRKLRLPPIEEQKVLAKKIELLSKESQRIRNNFQQKLNALYELKQSLLVKAFSGELTRDTSSEIREAVA
jgi:type I restriction enzyme S subunit